MTPEAQTPTPEVGEEVQKAVDDLMFVARRHAEARWKDIADLLARLARENERLIAQRTDVVNDNLRLEAEILAAESKLTAALAREEGLRAQLSTPTAAGEKDEVVKILADLDSWKMPVTENAAACIRRMAEEKGRLKLERDESREQFDRLVAFSADQSSAAEARVKELEAAVAWALGETDEWPDRQEGQGAFYWRTELRRRAGLPVLTYDKATRTLSAQQQKAGG